VQAKSYDLTIFKIKWGNLTLKIYDKGGRVLRIEVVVHNAKELRCGKMLDRLPTLLSHMQGMLIHFLGTVQAAHISFPDIGTFEGFTEPTTRGNRRLAGIDLNKAHNRHGANAVIELSTRPDGFTLAQFAETVRQRSGQDAKTYSTRNAAYDMAKMSEKRCSAGSSDHVATLSIRRGSKPFAAISSSARKSSSRCWQASSAPAARGRNTAPLSTNTTSHYARNSVEPFKPSASPQPDL
jgi:hypothetical protein